MSEPHTCQAPVVDDDWHKPNAEAGRRLHKQRSITIFPSFSLLEVPDDSSELQERLALLYTPTVKVKEPSPPSAVRVLGCS